ncbi:MAG: TolC family protein [Spirochaetia bacterium]|nr:TolC family protein [Spirochaetia bacterium]
MIQLSRSTIKLVPFLLLSVLWGMAGQSNQSVPSKELSLSEVLALALKNSPEFKRIDQTLSEKLARAIEAETLENPQVEIKSLSPFTQINIDVLQPIRLSWLGLRQFYAATLRKSAGADKQAALYEEMNRLTLRYYRLWLLEKQENLLRDWSGQMKSVLPRIEAALRGGEVPEVDGQLLKAEAIRFESEWDVVKSERDEAALDLIRATGIPFQNIRLRPPELKAIPEDVGRVKTFAKNKTNLLRATSAVLAATRLRSAVATLDILPAFAPRYYLEDGKSSGVGINFQIPLWDWNLAEQKKAKAEKDLAESEYRAFTNIGLDRMIEIRHRKTLALERRAGTYLRDVLPAYQKSYESSRNLLLQGQMGIRDFRLIQEKYIEITDTVLKDIAEALISRTDLEILIGGKIEEIP